MTLIKQISADFYPSSLLACPDSYREGVVGYLFVTNTFAVQTVNTRGHCGNKYIRSINHKTPLKTHYHQLPYGLIPLQWRGARRAGWLVNDYTLAVCYAAPVGLYHYVYRIPRPYSPACLAFRLRG